MVVLDCPCPRFCPCTMDAGIGERRKRVSWLSRSGEGVVMAALASASSATLGPDRRTTPGEPWSKAQLDAIGQTMHRLHLITKKERCKVFHVNFQLLRIECICCISMAVSRAMVLTALLGTPWSTVMSRPSMSVCKFNAQNQVRNADCIQKKGPLTFWVQGVTRTPE